MDKSLSRQISDVQRRAGSGKPIKTTPEQDGRLFQAVRAKPMTLLQELKGNHCVCSGGFIIINFENSSRCMRFARFALSYFPLIKEKGNTRRVPCIKEFLTDTQREERLAFANVYGDRSQAW